MVKKKLLAFSLLIGIAFASQQPSDFNAPLPPPPPPPSNNNDTNHVKTIIQNINLQNMTPKELIKYLKEYDTKQNILRETNFLHYGGEKTLYLRGTNTFNYTDTLPILFVFPYKIQNVVLYAGTGRILFNDKNVVFIPPNGRGKLVGFIVFFDNHKAVYFVGNRISIADKTKNQEYLTLYYKFVEPINYNPQTIIESFMSEYGRCPFNNEMINVDGHEYKFEKLTHPFLQGPNEFYCDTYLKIIELK